MKKAAMYSFAAVFSIMLLARLILYAETTSAIPDTPAGKRVKESLNIIDSGDMTQIQDYISTQFTRNFIKKFGKERLFDVYYGFYEKYKGLEFHKVRESSTHRFVGIFSCRQTGSAYLFGLIVLSRPPHKIQGMIIFPMTHPDQQESLESLTDKEKVEMLESYLDILGDSDVFSGSILLAKNGRVILKRAYGLANRQANVHNQIETRFNLASLNKMFTAVAVAQLCEQGKISYNDPVEKYIDSEWISPKISKNVRIMHLLSHTSGIRISKKDDNLKYLEESIANKFRRIGDYKSLTRGAFLKTDPGKEFSYSNIGFHLLGPIIEKVSGEEYYDYVQVHIFDVARMEDTGFDEVDQPDSDIAWGFIRTMRVIPGDRPYTKM